MYIYISIHTYTQGMCRGADNLPHIGENSGSIACPQCSASWIHWATWKNHSHPSFYSPGLLLTVQTKPQKWARNSSQDFRRLWGQVADVFPRPFPAKDLLQKVPQIPPKGGSFMVFSGFQSDNMFGFLQKSPTPPPQHNDHQNSFIAIMFGKCPRDLTRNSCESPAPTITPQNVISARAIFR